MVKRSLIFFSDQSCAPEFVERLRHLLYRLKSEQEQTICCKPTSSDAVSSFPFLKLPFEVRCRIYRLILLPANKQIHPYIKSWYDQTTRSVIPLFLTCRQIHQEAEDILYGCAIFSSSEQKYTELLFKFFTRLEPRLLKKIRYLKVNDRLIEDCDVFGLLKRRETDVVVPEHMLQLG